MQHSGHSAAGLRLRYVLHEWLLHLGSVGKGVNENINLAKVLCNLIGNLGDGVRPSARVPFVGLHVLRHVLRVVKGCIQRVTARLSMSRASVAGDTSASVCF